MAARARPREDTYEKVFSALAHPARRQILITLNMEGGSLAAGEIASLFEHAWPTTTRHLQALAEAGLVEQERQGRRQIYRLERKPLEIAMQWLATFGSSGHGPPTRRKT